MTFGDAEGGAHRADDPDPDTTIFSGKFWKRTADRAVKTFVYTFAVTMAGPAIVAGTGADVGGLLSVPWQGALTGSVAATVLSFLGSAAGKKIGNNPNDPSWLPTR